MQTTRRFVAALAGGVGVLLAAGCNPPPEPSFPDSGEVPAWCHQWPLPARLADGGFDVGGGSPFTAFDGGAFEGAGAADVGGGVITPLIGCFETTWFTRPWADAGYRPVSSKAFPGCASVAALCPPASAPPEDDWDSQPGVPEPFMPFDDRVPPAAQPAPGSACLDGMGWSFESGQYAPWTGTNVFLTNYAVYGNNVSVDRIRPPGYVTGGPNTPLVAVGGDYWQFSRDINYVGRYWAGSSDVRDNWRMAPGGRVGGNAAAAEAASGTLTSPPFLIATEFLSFLIGGHQSAGQRVELQVQATVNNRAALMAMYRGLGVEEPAPGGGIPPLEPETLWIVVRASTAVESNEYMRRRAVWDVSQLAGATARFRVVDTAGESAHVNVDDFRCEKSAPAGTQWLPADAGAPAIGSVLYDVPLWGVTDSHAHVVANTTLGGHYIWGDPEDPIENVYDCNRELPDITTRDGGVVRRGIAEPNQETSCFISSTVIAGIQAAGLGVCALTAAHVGLVPFVGPFLAAAALTACTVAVTAATVALTAVPSVRSVTLHGAAMPTSGGLRVGPFLEFLVGLFSELTPVHGMIEQQDWDTADGFHSGFGDGRTHQRYHETMIRRAYQGGLRLMVIDALHSRALQYVLDARDDVDDWQAIRTTVEAVKRLVAPDADPVYRPGVLRDIAELAYTPGQARDIIRRNKLAIVLGTETQELGKLRSPTDSYEQQVRDLYALGIRKVTPVHGVDNPLGGTGVFNDVYNSAQVFNNLTRDENGAADGVWEPLTPVPVFLPSAMPPPIGGMGLGEYEILSSLLPRERCTAGAACGWNLQNGGWFVTTNGSFPGSGTADGGGVDYIGETGDITFRVGIEGSRLGRDLSQHNPFTEPEFQFSNKLDSLQWLLGRGPGGIVPDARCSLDGMFFPLLGNLDATAHDNYTTSTHHLNAKGLSPQGGRFIEELMRHGMVVDTDHFGQRSRNDVFDALIRFRDEASSDGGAALPTGEYPVMAIHTDIRRYQRHGPYPFAMPYVLSHGFGAETDKTRQEIERIAASRGVVSPGVNGGVVDDPDDLVRGQVRNNCDYSSKAYAVKYLQFVAVTGGYGVTPSTDMNSPSPPLLSRFGTGTACTTGDTPERIAGVTDAGDGMPPLRSWPRDLSETGCRFASADLTTAPDTCASVANPRAQFLEFNGVEYDDYSGRAAAAHYSPPAARTDLRVVVAQRFDEYRDDRALMSRAIEQNVAYGGRRGLRQMRPMKKFRTGFVAANNRGWDVNLDGLGNEGLLPDVWQDMRNVGVSWEQLGPMFNSANDFIEMWETGCRMAEQWHRVRGLTPVAGCD